MQISDEEIKATFESGACTPEQLAHLMIAADVDVTGDLAKDVRELAEMFDVDVESLLYGITEPDSPLYQALAAEGGWSE